MSGHGGCPIFNNREKNGDSEGDFYGNTVIDPRSIWMQYKNDPCVAIIATDASGRI